jgi:hypothetical protein
VTISDSVGRGGSGAVQGNEDTTDESLRPNQICEKLWTLPAAMIALAFPSYRLRGKIDALFREPQKHSPDKVHLTAILLGRSEMSQIVTG